MKQLEIVSLVAAGRGEFTWTPLAQDLEVMAWPLRIDGVFVAVSARTASACAAVLTRPDWVVSLPTTRVEDMVYEQAGVRPEPVLLNPQRMNIASSAAIAEHSKKLLGRIGAAPRDTIVSCGKAWVLSNGLLDRPGRAANYGLFSTSAPYRSVTGAYRLWQPLSFVHNLEHYDYSQMLRLVRRRPGMAMPSYEQPLRVFELVRSATPVPAAPDTPPPVSKSNEGGVANGTLGERCLAWCLEEAASHRIPDAARIAWYHAVAVRHGRPLRITTGNHCASAQSRAAVESLLPGEKPPHEPRAAAIELQTDAKGLGFWHPIQEVRAGKWLPRPGDLAIYDRSSPAEPSTSWQRHVNRVIQVSASNNAYENIGANELASAWRREWSSFDNPKLLGFVAYPPLALADTPHSVCLLNEVG